MRISDWSSDVCSSDLEPTPAYRLARRMEERLEFAAFPLSSLAKFTAWDVPINPVRPLPPVGGLPRLHGIEPHEVDVSLPLGERVGHSLVLGTTRVGKTRLAELDRKSTRLNSSH